MIGSKTHLYELQLASKETEISDLKSKDIESCYYQRHR